MIELRDKSCVYVCLVLKDCYLEGVGLVDIDKNEAFVWLLSLIDQKKKMLDLWGRLLCNWRKKNQ